MEYIAEDFKMTGMTVATLAISIYLLGLALGPLVISSLSEMYGRLVVYHSCNVLFLAFIIACAVSQSTAQFIVFRFLSGCAGAAPLTIGGGTIADVIPVEKRGLAAALFGLGPLLGPVCHAYPPLTSMLISQVLGPVIGGFVSEYKGWRWTFWIVAILVSIQTA